MNGPVRTADLNEFIMTTKRLLSTARKTAGLAVFLLTLTSPLVLDAQSLTGSGPGETQSIAPQSADVGAASLRDNTPLVSSDSSLMFFNSARKGYRPWATWDSVKMRYDEDIYYARRNTNPADGRIWESPLNLGAEINTSHDDAIAAISRNGRTVYFTSLKKGWEKDGGPYYQAELTGTKWSGIKGMGDGITEFFLKRDRSLNFRVYGATISPDGKDF